MENSADDSRLLDISTNDQTLAKFKESFYRDNLQLDSLSKVFQEDVTITHDDILDLNKLVIEKLNKYENAGLIVNVYVKLGNKKQIVFSSWYDFEQYKWLESTTISRIVISWKFNVCFPNHEKPQQHTLTVKLTNNMRPDEMFKLIFSGENEEVDSFETNFFPVYAKVNFINRSLGDEFLDTVGEWVNGLSESELKKNKIILKLRKHKRFLAKTLEIVTFLSLTYFAFTYISNYLDSLSFGYLGQLNLMNLKSIVMHLFGVVGYIYLARKGTETIGKITFSQLGNYGDKYLFSITKGDRNQLKKLKKEAKYDLMNLIVSLIGTVIFNVIINVISSWLTP